MALLWYKGDVETVIQSTPKVLLWDLEVAKMHVSRFVYDLKQYSSYIPHKAIQRDKWILCAAWKWIDEGYVASTSVLNDPERFKDNYADDYHVVKTMYDLIMQADALIAHNGDGFDWKIFTSRCIFHDLPPPKKPILIDTLKAARKEFKFSSNALGYLARFLNVEDKGQAPDWDAIAFGDAEAIKYAERYCRQDIKTLEGIYKKLRPYMTGHANLNAVLEGVHHHTCPKCGHWDQVKRGFKYTMAGKYQAYACSPATGGCGGWSKHKKNLKTVDIR